MSLFCLLWVPVFYLLRRSLVGGGGAGSVWALLFGSITAIFQFILGDIVSPGGFGFTRGLYGFIDLVSLPVIIPIVVCLLLLIFNGFSGDADFANFALLWMIPIGALRALGWSADSDPLLLILIPILWTALAAGIPFFINWMSINPFIASLAILCMIALPVAAAAAYWAFFSQYMLLGFGLLLITNIPLAFSLTIARN